jgi:hypothetical protein
MTTRAIEAKMALFDRLEEETQAGRILYDADNPIQTKYEWPGGEAQLRCVYGGGYRFSQDDAVAERGVLVQEVALVSVYIRVCNRPATPVAETDFACSEIVRKIGKTLKRNPELQPGLGLMWSALRTGQGDYSRTDQETISIVSLQVEITSLFGFDED